MDMKEAMDAVKAFTDESEKEMEEAMNKIAETSEAIKTVEETEPVKCKVSFLEYENVLKKLPLSYYAGRPINAFLEEHAETSWYDPIADEITISYDVIKDAFQKLKYPEEVEELTRGMLYHEVSHAIMSPSTLYKDCNALKRHVMNIFEDERIETILRDYYLGVNFKKNIVLLCDYHGEPAQSAMEDFFNTVRFRRGEEDCVKEVQTIINTYSKIVNDNVNNSGYPSREVTNYQSDVFNLLIKVAKKWYKKNKKDELDKKAKERGGKSFDSLPEFQQDSIVSSMLDEENKSLNQKTIIFVSSDGEESKDEKGSEKGTGKASGDGKEEMKAIAVDAESKQASDAETDPDGKGGRRGGLNKGVQKMLDTVLNREENAELTKKIAEVFEQFTAREKNQGAAMRRYSGVLNPRNLTREDWRIWEYKSKEGPIKGYDKLHLNLFIDTSGSYYDNVQKTNELLRSLITLEQKYSYFDFDLVTCQVGEKIRSKKERHIQAGGGNDLDDKIWGIYAQLQKKDAFNYNIVLFDGYACTDCRKDHEKNFGAFNNSKCSIIAEDDNKEAIERYAPNARHIFMKSGRRDYAMTLHENIVTCLQRALM